MYTVHAYQLQTVTLQFPLVALNKISWCLQFPCSNISCNFILTNTKIAEQLTAVENYTCKIDPVLARRGQGEKYMYIVVVGMYFSTLMNTNQIKNI